MTPSKLPAQPAPFSDPDPPADIEKLQTLVTAEMEKIDARANLGHGLTGLLCGFAAIDEMTNGFHGGELIIVGGRPSMGKTALLLSMAQKMAVVNQVPIAVFSMNTGRALLAQRMLALRAQVEVRKIRKNTLDPHDRAALARAARELSAAPMHIDSAPLLSLTELRTKARRLVLEHGIKAVFVDYVQLMTESGFPSRHEEIAFISRGIKALARELDVPIICLSQLGRQAERGYRDRPRMSDLRGIEHDADVVMLLYREEYYHNGDKRWRHNYPEKMGLTEIIIDKQSSGPTGIVELQFNEATASFHDREKSNDGKTDASTGPYASSRWICSGPPTTKPREIHDVFASEENLLPWSVPEAPPPPPEPPLDWGQ